MVQAREADFKESARFGGAHGCPATTPQKPFGTAYRHDVGPARPAPTFTLSQWASKAGIASKRPGHGLREEFLQLRKTEGACRIALSLFGEGQPTGAAPDQWYAQPRLKRGKAFTHR